MINGDLSYLGTIFSRASAERRSFDMTNITNYTEGGLQNLENIITDSPQRPEMNDKIGLLQFIDIWMDLFKKNSVKQASYGRLLQSKKTLEKYAISKKSIGEISFFDVQRYVNELVANGYGVSGLKKQVLIVTAPLRQAAAMKIINADPCVGVKMPVEDKVMKKSKEILAYTNEEQEKLWKEIKDSPTVGYIAVGFMIETGLRSGELLALKWCDLQIDRSRMHVHATIVNPMYVSAVYQDSPKSKSSNRVIPLTARAKALLNLLIKQRKTEWVFEQDGERYTYQKLQYQTKKLCREAGVKFYGEHVFRHTFATNCYYKGIDVKILGKLMGHSSVQVTYNTYVNLYGDGFDDMYAALCF